MKRIYGIVIGCLLTAILLLHVAASEDCEHVKVVLDNDGMTEYWYCDICGESFYDDLTQNDKETETAAPQTEEVPETETQPESETAVETETEEVPIEPDLPESTVEPEPADPPTTWIPYPMEPETDAETEPETSDAEVPPVPVNPFIDIGERHPAYEAIRYTNEHALFFGIPTEDGLLFAPTEVMSRAMFVTVLGRLAGVDVSKMQTESAFSDVVDGEWYVPYVAWATEEGIVCGYDNGSFGVNDPVTVEQALTFLARFAQSSHDSDPANYPCETKVAAFRDGDNVSPWAVTSVGWALCLDLYAPSAENGIEPQTDINRVCIAEILYRYSVMFGYDT